MLMKILLGCAAAAALVGCSGGDSSSAPAPQPPVSVTPPPPAPTPPPPPAPISVSELTGSQTPALTAMEFMAPGSGAQPATLGFSGVLEFGETAFLADVGDSSIVPGYRRLVSPGFTIELVTDGDDLIPANRNIISTWPSTGSVWDVIVGAGKVWSEAGDGAWNRASLPITLVSRRVGEARNCVALFVYDGSAVSSAYMQCSQELAPICCYRPGDYRTLAPLAFTPAIVPGEAQIIADYRADIANDLPVADWSAINVPDTDALKATFNDIISAAPEWQSLGAIVIDGVIHRQTPLTRHGEYPYPREMRHGVFSATKSMSGALALLYLAERYGDQVFDARITDYVAPYAALPEWQGVTFEHALDMATGTRGSDNQLDLGLIRADSADDAIAAIGLLGDASPSPGTVWNYATTNYFVLSFAMQKYVEAQEGPGVFYWDLVQENVLDPIGVEGFAIQKTLESNGSDGIPTLGIGAFPTMDDSAKIAQLFMDAGEFGGMQLLHRQRTLDATGRGAYTGYPAGGGIRYQHSFRKLTYTSSRPGACAFDGSFMEGLGGSYVLLVPSNGLIALRYMDRDIYNTRPLADALDQVRPAC